MPPISTLHLAAAANDANGTTLHTAVFSLLAMAIAIAYCTDRINRPARPHVSRWLKHCARPDEPRAQQKMVQHDTGYQVDTLDELWDNFNDALPRQLYPDDPEIAEAFFYLSFVYIHYYPTNAQSPRVLWTPQLQLKGRGITTDQLKAYIIPTIVALALAMKDTTRSYRCIRWEDRLRHDNHTALIPSVVTGAVDTGPVLVCQPKRRKMSRLLYQPKYHACVYKFQLIVSFLGHIVGYSGLHNGTEPDCNIWNQTQQHHQMGPDEKILADGIYIGIPELIVKYDKDQTADGGRAHQDTNDIIDLYRARVEHLMHEVSIYTLVNAP
jgi:hypothetical protein